ncbi:hypothetical protein F5148DRAFT_1147724 [Russula earlei]|uniref:Uncharacterized protein n=1 Tax=Russula earlei TaxID=71964 RepID=A0ACC0UGI5_9AGAM|nr:hypothetical protein F5148DRAFT_1147724 [Russula earlei]
MTRIQWTGSSHLRISSIVRKRCIGILAAFWIGFAAVDIILQASGRRRGVISRKWIPSHVKPCNAAIQQLTSSIPLSLVCPFLRSLHQAEFNLNFVQMSNVTFMNNSGVHITLVLSDGQQKHVPNRE